MAEKKVSLETLDAKIDALGREIECVDDNQRKNGVLLERLESKFSLLYEGYVALDGRMSQLEERVQKTETIVYDLNGGVGLLEKRVEEGFAAMDLKFEFIIEKLNQKIDKVLRPA